jgi:hypothetical protein
MSGVSLAYQMRYHGTVSHLCVGWAFISSSGFHDMGILGQHVLMRNPNMIKEDESIVEGIQPEFGADIADSYPRQWLVCL